MLVVKNLNLSYPKSEQFLKDISFQVEEGEAVLLAGLSGSGKSSILNAINGIAKNYDECSISGEVLYNGRNLLDEKMYKIASLISTVFQNPKTHFFNVDTTRELLFYLENIGLKREEMKKRLDALLTLFPISHLLDRSIFDLSGGEKQILCIASAYISGNKIIMLDEPSSNLDEKYTEILRTMLTVLKEKRITLIIAEHRLYYVRDIIDKVILIKKGIIEQIFTGSEFFTETDEFFSKNGLRSPRKTALKKPFIKTALLESVPKDGLFIKNLQYNFTKNRALEVKHILFNFGKIYGIVGKNGCGKSTFIKSLIGLLKKSKEEIFIDGRKLSKNARIKISSLVMQDVNHQLFTDSLKNELLLNNEEARPEVDGVLERLSLLAYKERHPMSLSGGQKQRLAIAQVALSRKSIVCFDEPTSGMDYKHCLEIAFIIQSLKKSNTIILIISHDTEFLNLTVDEVVNVENRSKTIEPK